MHKPLNLFDWEQEPTVDRSERLSRQSADAPTVQIATILERPTSAAAWEQLRDAPQARDAVLSPLAIAWRANLPVSSRPAHLCTHFPRIANRLALSWKDRTLVKLILDNLLSDKRGGRQGFPPDIAQELRLLRQEASRAESSPV